MIDTKLSKNSEDDCKIGHSNYIDTFFLIADLGTYLVGGALLLFCNVVR